jgi:hypothetical protein
MWTALLRWQIGDKLKDGPSLFLGFAEKDFILAFGKLLSVLPKFKLPFGRQGVVTGSIAIDAAVAGRVVVLDSLYHMLVVGDHDVNFSSIVPQTVRTPVNLSLNFMCRPMHVAASSLARAVLVIVLSKAAFWPNILT